MNSNSASTSNRSGATPASTGSIPLSWARPAEDVSADTVGGSKLPLFAAVVLGLLAAAVGGIALSKVVAEPPPPAPAVVAIAPIVAGPVAPEPVPVAPAPIAPAPIAPGVVAVDDEAAAQVDEAARKRARVLLRAARFAAKDGDFTKASALAEDAVDKDPGCAECWATVGFLRRRAGDLEGFQAARLKARTLAP